MPAVAAAERLISFPISCPMRPWPNEGLRSNRLRRLWYLRRRYRRWKGHLLIRLRQNAVSSDGGSSAGGGEGSGSGTGTGSGEGSGSGSGYGEGIGSGSGDGVGDGEGYGEGSGSGQGSGDSGSDGTGTGAFDTDGFLVPPSMPIKSYPPMAVKRGLNRDGLRNGHPRRQRQLHRRFCQRRRAAGQKRR